MLRLQRLGWVTLAGCLLVACSNSVSPTSDTLPTVAQLPDLPTSIPAVTSTALQVTEVEPNHPQPVPTVQTPQPTPPVGVPTVELDPSNAAAVGVDLDVFPAVLEVGQIISVRGLLTVSDASAGLAILTDSRDTQIDILLDSFAAQVANNQVVEIIGEVVERAESASGVAVRMTGIRVFAEVTSEADPNGPIGPAATAPPPGG